MRSWRCNGSTSSYLETMTLAMALASAITCGNTLGGRGAMRTTGVVLSAACASTVSCAAEISAVSCSAVASGAAAFEVIGTHLVRTSRSRT
jgi:hypothetical protein